MEFVRIDAARSEELAVLHRAYKEAIGEDAPTRQDMDTLLAAMERGEIQFYGCLDDGGQLVGCCSVSPAFSTFNYARAGVFEDFYIVPACRGKGIARKLVQFAVVQSGVQSLTVGCADCDVDLYKALGFTIPLGNMLAYDL